MYLPDSPVPIDFEEQGPNWVLMTIGEGGEYGKWLLPGEELDKALLDGAFRFFKGLCDAFSKTTVQQYNLKALYKEAFDIRKNILVIS